MTVLYFTSTGNSLYVAKQIGGKLISIPQAIKNNEYKFKDDKIGIVCPVYYLSVPVLVRKFLSKVTFECNYLFGILTFGDNKFAAEDDLNTISMKSPRNFDYINTVKMVENYIPMYEMDKQIKKAQGYGTHEQIINIKNDIDSQKAMINKFSWIAKKITGINRKSHCLEYDRGLSNSFTVNDKCIGCGICKKVCPMNNIKLNNGNIEYNDKCIKCCACIHNCPQNAIHLKSEKSFARYINPQINLNEIINANL